MIKETGYTYETLQKSCLGVGLSPLSAGGIFPDGPFEIWSFQVNEWNYETRVLDFNDEKKLSTDNLYEAMEKRLLYPYEYKERLFEVIALSFYG